MHRYWKVMEMEGDENTLQHATSIGAERVDSSLTGRVCLPHRSRTTRLCPPVCWRARLLSSGRPPATRARLQAPICIRIDVSPQVE